MNVKASALIVIILCSIFLGIIVFGIETPTSVYLKIIEPDFTLNVSPSSVSITPGQSASATIYITANQQGDEVVTLSIDTSSNIPSGTNIRFDPTGINIKVSSGTSKQVGLKISTITSTPSGSYSIMIKGYDGVRTKYSLFTLIITSGLQPTSTPPATTPITLPSSLHAADIKSEVIFQLKSGTRKTFSDASSIYLQKYEALPPNDQPMSTDWVLSVKDFPMPSLPEKQLALITGWGTYGSGFYYYVPVVWVMTLTLNAEVKIDGKTVWTSPSAGTKAYWCPTTDNVGQSTGYLLTLPLIVSGQKQFYAGSGWQIVADMKGFDISKFIQGKQPGETILIEYYASYSFNVYLIWQLWRVLPFVPLPGYVYGKWVGSSIPISWDNPVDKQPYYVSPKPEEKTRSFPYTIPSEVPKEGDFVVFTAESIDIGRNVEASKRSLDVGIQSFYDFSSPVSLNVLGLPTGVTGTFTKTSVTPSKNGVAFSVLNLLAISNAKIGTFTVTIKGTSGTLVKTCTFSLSVKEEAEPEPPAYVETTRIEASLSASNVKPLIMLTVSGRLVGTTIGKPIGDKTIKVWSSFDYKTEVKTLSDGSFSAQVQAPSTEGAYAIYLQFMGDNTYGASNPVSLPFEVSKEGGGYPSLPDPFKAIYDLFYGIFGWLGAEGAKLLTWIVIIVIVVIILWIIYKIATRPRRRESEYVGG